MNELKKPPAEKRTIKGAVRTIISMNNVIADLNKQVKEAASKEEASRLEQLLEKLNIEEEKDRKTLEEEKESKKKNYKITKNKKYKNY